MLVRQSFIGRHRAPPPVSRYKVQLPHSLVQVPIKFSAFSEISGNVGGLI